MKSCSRSPMLLSMLSLITILLIILSPAQPWLVAPPTALAQIDNTQPTLPYASVVECIRSGGDLGKFSHESPRFAAACLSSAWNISSYEQPGDPANGDAPFNDAAVYEFGDGLPNASGEPGHTNIASIGTNGSNGGGIGLGAVYGLAYTSGTNPADPAFGTPRLYASAFAKRITRFGPGGPGAIYLLNRATNNETLYVQIPQVIPGPSGAPGNPGSGNVSTFPDGTNVASYTPSMGGLHSLGHDSTLIAMAGRVGLGDLDLDPQGRYLYGVNLYARSVFRIDTWSTNPQASLSYLPQAPILTAPQSCNASGASGPQDMHVFGLGVTSGAVYLGFVCAADGSQNRADLSAGVTRYLLSSGTWETPLAFPLASFDIQRRWPAPSFSNLSSWQPWKNDATGQGSPLGASFRIDPQPILADITFDERWNMVLGLRDRFGDIGLTPITNPTYPMAQGDLLVALANSSGGWNAPIAAGTEHFVDNSPFEQMPEEAAGAVAYIPGEHNGQAGGEIITSIQDPYGANAGGMAWYSVGGGARQSSEELYSNFTAAHRFAKASGLGDVELLCDWRAIGDRIWRDSNSNGMQDSGEPDITGVLINLKDSSDNIIAQVTSGPSNILGNYRFYVNPYLSYTVEIDPSNYAPGKPLEGMGPTLPNTGDDSSDSDADLNSRIAIPPAGASDVNVSFDVGFSIGANVKITKSGPASAAVGSSFAYGLLYANDGPSTAQNVIITDTLPAGITFVSATPAPSSINGQLLTWNLGSIGVGANASIAVNVQVDVHAPANVLNSTQISTSSSGNTPGDDDSSISTQITHPNIYVQKTGTASVRVGDTITYSLSYGNNGTSQADSVSIVDSLPAGVSFVSANPAPNNINGQQLTWNLGTLAAGATGSITVNGTAMVNAANLVTNGASISTPSPGDNPSDNSSSTSTTVLRPNVTMTKTGPTTTTVGEALAYSLAYTNNGNAAADYVMVVDTLPAGVSFVSANPTPSNINGQQLTWNLGTLAAGATGSISVNVISSATLQNGTSLLNSVTITSTTGGDNPDDNTSTTTTIMQRADVYVTKSSSTVFPVVSGSSVSYMIDYGNHGPASASNVTLSDPMPTQLSNVTWQCLAGCTASGSGSITNLALGNLGAGATGRITVTGTASTSMAREDFSNTAMITTLTPETPRTPDNNQSTVPGAVWTSDVQVVKAATPQVTAGTNFTATLSYRNNGPAPAQNVVLTDTLPAGTSFVSSTPAPSSQNGQTLSWNIGTLADAASSVVTITMRSDTALADGSMLVNQTHISTSTSDRTPENNDSSSSTLVVTRADLRTVKVGPSDVNVGQAVSYTITYTNDGPSVARHVVISDTLPTELEYVSANPIPASNANGMLSWNVGDLAVGAGGTIMVELATKTSTQAMNTIQASNTVQIKSTPDPTNPNNPYATSDPTPGNNTSTTSTNIHKPEVAIAKAGPSQSLAGERIVYTLMYDNHGAAPAHAVIVDDVLPAGISYVSASPTPSRVQGQTLTWNIGMLAVGASGMINVMVQIQQDAPVALVNSATIRTPSPGDDPGNNSSSTTTTLASIGTIGDTVWRDDDGNGSMDIGEPGLPDVTIALSDAETQHLIATTRTDALGHYLFKGLGTGRYLLRVTAETTQLGSYRGYRLTTESIQSSVIDTTSLEDLERDFGMRPQPTTDVTLTKLHASANAQGTTISWRTIADIDTQRFRVV